MTNLKHIYNNHVCFDMSFTGFKNICKLLTNKYEFIVLDKESPSNNGSYRESFNQYITLYMNNS